MTLVWTCIYEFLKLDNFLILLLQLLKTFWLLLLTYDSMIWFLWYSMSFWTRYGKLLPVIRYFHRLIQTHPIRIKIPIIIRLVYVSQQFTLNTIILALSGQFIYLILKILCLFLSYKINKLLPMMTKNLNKFFLIFMSVLLSYQLSFVDFLSEFCWKLVSMMTLSILHFAIIISVWFHF